MTAINHSLTGAVIGLWVGGPWLAVPLAIISHYVCDAIPHFGLNVPPEAVLVTTKFRNYLLVEALLCFLLVMGLASLRPEHWLLAAACAFAAAAPDFLSVNRYLTVRRGQTWTPGRYTKFAQDIQWFERPIGGAVEIAWFIAACMILTPLLA